MAADGDGSDDGESLETGKIAKRGREGKRMREGEGGWPGKGGGGGGSPVLLMPFSQSTWLDGSTLRRCHVECSSRVSHVVGLGGRSERGRRGCVGLV